MGPIGTYNDTPHWQFSAKCRVADPSESQIRPGAAYLGILSVYVLSLSSLSTGNLGQKGAPTPLKPNERRWERGISLVIC